MSETSPATSLRSGFTTGACAAAGAQAAAQALLGAVVREVMLVFPDGRSRVLPIESVEVGTDRATAVVRKDAGDDPDVTHGLCVETTVAFRLDDQILFRAGVGVGTVTRPGLALSVGEPAINPGPRGMIQAALRAVTEQGAEVTVSIPEGLATAEKTFNPRLGITGGLSVLGTTGIVRPYSHEALLAGLRCGLDVALASGVKQLILVPGNMGRRAAMALLPDLAENIVEVSNLWGDMLSLIPPGAFDRLVLVGHPGKLAKLAMDHWQTHSSQSPSAVPLVLEELNALGGSLDKSRDELQTVQAVFDALPSEQELALGHSVAERVARAVSYRLGKTAPHCEVILIDLQGSVLGRG